MPWRIPVPTDLGPDPEPATAERYDALVRRECG